jgi:hypothetical protein
MRFIIYREEFVDGRRTTDLPAAIFATEDEATARNQMATLFAKQTEDYRQQFSPIEIKQKEHSWTLASPTHSRLVSLGLIDEQDGTTYLPQAVIDMLLTESHKKRNRRMKDRAEKSSAERPMTVAEAIAQSERVKAQSSRNSEADAKVNEPEPNQLAAAPSDKRTG